eukprot:366345-Chlamydomonas_euryale.AAC.8
MLAAPVTHARAEYPRGCPPRSPPARAPWPACGARRPRAAPPQAGGQLLHGHKTKASGRITRKASGRMTRNPVVAVADETASNPVTLHQRAGRLLGRRARRLFGNQWWPLQMKKPRATLLHRGRRGDGDAGTVLLLRTRPVRLSTSMCQCAFHAPHPLAAFSTCSDFEPCSPATVHATH